MMVDVRLMVKVVSISIWLLCVIVVSVSEVIVFYRVCEVSVWLFCRLVSGIRSNRLML